MSYPYLIRPREGQLRALKDIFRTKRRLVHGDMGTGKTKIGVDFIGNMVWHKKLQKALVICPLEAFGVWEEEIEANAPFLTFSFMDSDRPEPDWDVNIIITNYEYACPRSRKRILTKGKRKGKKKRYVDWKFVNALIDWAPQCIIIDEGHKIKNPKSRRAKALHKMGRFCEYAIDLTGTPTGNKRTMDVWSHFEFLKSGLLDESFNEHKRRYGVWGGFGGFKLLKPKNEAQLARIIAPYITTIESTDLPPQIFIPRPIILPKRARELYDEMEEEFLIEVEDTTITATIALSKAMKLCQLAGGFIIDNEKKCHMVHSAKLDSLKEIMDDLREQGTERVVIFARFLWEIARIKEYLAEWNIYRVQGKVPKEEMVRFRTGDTNIMLCQIASGSIANNFQSANYELFYSTDYSSINWRQAIKRIHRMGQDKKCFYYMLASKGTIDTHIYRLHRKEVEMTKEFFNMVKEMRNDRTRRTGRSR